MRFTTKVSIDDRGEVEGVVARVQAAAQARLQGSDFSLVKDSEGDLTVRSVQVQVEQSQEDGVKDVRVSWAHSDDHLGSTILQAVQALH